MVVHAWYRIGVPNAHVLPRSLPHRLPRSLLYLPLAVFYVYMQYHTQQHVYMQILHAIPTCN